MDYDVIPEGNFIPASSIETSTVTSSLCTITTPYNGEL